MINNSLSTIILVRVSGDLEKCQKIGVGIVLRKLQLK